MAKPYSQDLRDRVVRAVLAGQSRRKAARSFEISASRGSTMNTPSQPRNKPDPNQVGSSSSTRRQKRRLISVHASSYDIGLEVPNGNLGWPCE